MDKFAADLLRLLQRRIYISRKTACCNCLLQTNWKRHTARGCFGYS